MIKILLKIGLFAGFFLLTSIISAQTWDTHQFGLNDGLNQSQVLNLFQDKKGNIWIATNGGGVNKYNGKEFISYTKRNGLPNNYVYSITEDKDGKIYFGTGEGLSIFDGTNFKNFGIKDGLPGAQVFKVLIDNSGIVWLGTEKGVVKIVNNKLIKVQECSQLNDTKIWTIFQDSYNTIWFGTVKKGLVRYEKSKYTVYTTKDSLQHNYVISLCQDLEGRIWIATISGINYFDYRTNQIYKTGKPFVIASMLASKSGEIWVGTLVGNVTKYKVIKKGINASIQKVFRVVDKGKSVDQIFCLLEDKENNLWVGTNNGIKKINNFHFFNFNKTDSLLNDNVTSMFKRKNGEYWIGTTKGIFVMSLDHVRQAKFKEIPPSSVFVTAVRCFVETKYLWFATNSGISKYDGKKFFNYTTAGSKKESSLDKNDKRPLIAKDNLCFEGINTLYVSGDSILWVGTAKGVTQIINDSLFVNFNDQYPDLKGKDVWNIYEDTKGILWFTTNYGAYALKNGKLTHYGKKEGFVEERICSVVEDKNNNLWFGSKSGIFKYDYKKFTNIRVDNGLSSDNILLLIFDNDDNLFVGNDKGIDVLNVKFYNQNQKIQVRTYKKYDGFMGQECNINSCLKESDGKLWFGTPGGITIYDPESDFLNNIKPVTQITKIQLNYSDIDSSVISLYAKGIDLNTLLPVNLVLPYNKNSLTFHFVATSLSIPAKVRYKFKLEGLTEDWSPALQKSEADYQGLPDGTFTFKVRACNDDGVWNDIPATFTFTITPPFWKTWWFYTILVILTVIGIVFYIKQRERKLIKEKQILEEKVVERTAELYQANEEITAQRDDIQEKNNILHEQKEEITLQAAELEKLSIVASETDNAVMIMDGKGHFEWINEGFTKMYGFTLEELKHQLGSNILDNTGNTHLRELIEAGFESQEPIIYEAQTHTKWGDKLWAQTTISPIFNSTGELIKLVAIDSNIHKMKLAEEEIMQQKEEIEAQRDEIGEQKKIVEEKNKDITDSINYAKNIQSAILPSISNIQNSFPNTFVLFKPRDIVSGDFYWYNENDNFSFFAAVDCTGHGVPGAFMSMLGFAFLNEIVNKENICDPSIVLNKLREQIVKSLHQEGKLTDSKDGMDIVLLMLNKKTKHVQYAGANNPLYLIRNKEMIEYKGDKMPIAYHLRMEPFSKRDLQLEPGDTLFLFSDGFADQFGGPKGKKFMYKRLKELLLEIQDHPMEEQKQLLDYAIEEWMHYTNPDTGHPFSQIDDILLIGVRV